MRRGGSPGSRRAGRGGLSLLIALALTACAGGPLELPAAPGPVADLQASDTESHQSPSGAVTVAYPAPPAAWLPAFHQDPAAVDLSSLWGLPFYAADPWGQLRPRLATGAHVADVSEGWAVDVDLAAGQWSDGRPVSASDVVATIAALREADLDADIEPLRRAEVRAPGVVRLHFDRPTARWPWILSASGGVLPGHVLESEGLGAFRGVPPVTGGPFRVADQTEGLEVVFEPHVDSPAAIPLLERLVVTWVPSYETALGLLEAGDVDLVMGHLALDADRRAQDLPGVVAETPLGGTGMALRFRADGGLGGEQDRDARRAVAHAVRLQDFVDGLLDEDGRLSRSPLPGVNVDFDEPPPPALSLSALDDLTLEIGRWQEVPAFAARAMRRDLQLGGGDLEILRKEPVDLYRGTGVESVAQLVETRDSPRPSLLGLAATSIEEERLVIRSGDEALDPSHGAAQTAMGFLLREGRHVPLFRVAVAHAWHEELSGVRPSAWPGLAFWNAAEWTISR